MNRRFQSDSLVSVVHARFCHQASSGNITAISENPVRCALFFVRQAPEIRRAQIGAHLRHCTGPTQTALVLCKVPAGYARVHDHVADRVVVVGKIA